MKIALIHEYFTVFAGAERVTKEILALFPDADVFTLLDTMNEGRGFLEGRSIAASPLNRFPRVGRYYRHLFPLYPWAVERFDMSGYDLIISSSHSAAKGVRKKPGQVHVCYCHSPPRWAWDLKQQYLQESNMDRGIKGWLAARLVERFRRWDEKASKRVDHYIANSQYIQERIKRTYGRDSVVIYPPVNTNAFTLHGAKDDFYLVVSRFVWYKKVRVAVEAFNAMPDRRLVVVGGGPQVDELTRLAGPNVEVLGHVDQGMLQSLMQRARALIFVAEEDFGIAPVEAQACGTPVVAYGKGGACETVIDGETGILFDRQEAVALQEAVARYESMRWDPDRIRQNAERFSVARFRSEFAQFMKSLTADRR